MRELGLKIVNLASVFNYTGTEDMNEIIILRSEIKKGVKKLFMESKND